MTSEAAAKIEQAIADLGEGTPEYHEALAFYLITLARAQWRAADRARERQRRKAERDRRAQDALQTLARMRRSDDHDD